MKNKHLLVGRELGRKKWTLKIGAINVAIFGKYAADFGFLALVTLAILEKATPRLQPAPLESLRCSHGR